LSADARSLLYWLPALEDRWKPSIQHDQEQAKLDATSHPALQHNQLMTERRVLGLKSAL
jgi:hypothetical protein